MPQAFIIAVLTFSWSGLGNLVRSPYCPARGELRVVGPQCVVGSLGFAALLGLPARVRVSSQISIWAFLNLALRVLVLVISSGWARRETFAVRELAAGVADLALPRLVMPLASCTMRWAARVHEMPLRRWRLTTHPQA